MSSSSKTENVSIYLQRFSYKLYQLLDEDLRELSRMFGRVASEYTDFKKQCDLSIENFILIDNSIFKKKDFLKSVDPIRQTFKELEIIADQRRDETVRNGGSSKSPSPVYVKERESSRSRSGIRVQRIDSKGSLEKLQKETSASISKKLGESSELLNSTSMSSNLAQKIMQIENNTKRQSDIVAKPSVGGKSSPKKDGLGGYRWKPNEGLLMEAARKEREANRQEMATLKQYEEAAKRREEEIRVSNAGKLEEESVKGDPNDEISRSSPAPSPMMLKQAVHPLSPEPQSIEVKQEEVVKKDSQKNLELNKEFSVGSFSLPLKEGKYSPKASPRMRGSQASLKSEGEGQNSKLIQSVSASEFNFTKINKSIEEPFKPSPTTIKESGENETIRFETCDSPGQNDQNLQKKMQVEPLAQSPGGTRKFETKISKTISMAQYEQDDFDLSLPGKTDIIKKRLLLSELMGEILLLLH